MDTKYIDNFKKDHYERIWNEFLAGTGKYITENKTEIFQRLRKDLEDFITVIVEIQKNIPIQVSVIQMSVLLTSIAEGKPVIRYEAFGEKGVLGEHIIAKEEDCSWMFTEWEAFGNKLEETVKELNLINFISKEQIWQLQFMNMFMFICWIAYMFKYDFTELIEFDGFNKMLISKPFRLTFGAYRDWQKVLYAIKDEVDIYLQPDMNKLRFHQFLNIIYSNKTIEGRLFNHSTFTGCKFKDVAITDSDFSDCKFDNCTFENVTFKNCQARGIIFKNCIIRNSYFKEMDFSNGLYVRGDELLDIYRRSQIIECRLSKLEIEICNLKGMIAIDNQDRKIVVDDRSILDDTIGIESWRAIV